MNTTKEERMAVATEIWNQVLSGVGIWAVMSWGVSKKVACEYNGMPALQIRVSGLIHKGWVVVALNYGTDTYEVDLVSVSGKLKKHHDEVYCDNLGWLIDREVERGEMSEQEYKRKALADSERKMASI